MPHPSELPDFPAAVIDRIAVETARYANLQTMRVCPSWVEAAVGVNLVPFIRQLIETGGAAFYAGHGLVCRWDADDCLLYVTKTH